MPKTKADLRRDYMASEGIKTAAVSNRIAAVMNELPMSSEDAMFVLAHRAGFKLAKYGLDNDELKRVVGHIQSLGAKEARTRAAPTFTAPTPAEVAPTPAALFNSRNFHPTVVSRSRKAFTTGQHNAAVERAFKSVNNRVKNLSGIHKDGNKLMTAAFKPDNPVLTFSDRNTQSQQDEQLGLMMLFQGAVVGLRNPRSHEDHWDRDDDVAYVLETLAFASLLHRMLDIAEERLDS